MSNPIADPLVEVVDSDARSDLVLIEAIRAGAATITINRASHDNAFNAEVIGALIQAFETLAAADGVRVVFLAGAGTIFSGGADLEWMRDAADHTSADNLEDAMQMAVMLRHLHELPQLTVALIQGGAFGGGAGLAAACDLAIATQELKFAFAEVKLGLIPATISPYVVGAIGQRRARGLFATGREFDARFALQIGLIDELVADSAALEKARDRIAAEIMACAPGAITLAKRLAVDVAGRKVDHGLMEDTAHRIARARVGEEGQEGVAAFLAGRPPAWKV